MHALLIAIGSHGDVHPFVGLGAKLRSRGHRVSLATNEYFEPLVRRAGLDFLPLGAADDYLRVMENPDLWHGLRSFRVVCEHGIAPLLAPTYDLVAKHAASGETVVVVTHPLGFGARVAHEKLGIPLASVQLAPAPLRSAHEAPKFAGMFMPRWFPTPVKRAMFRLADRLVINPVVAPKLNEFRATKGLAPVGDPLLDWWHAPQLLLCFFPEWFAAPQPDWPPQARMVGFPLYDESPLQSLSPELEQFLRDGPPPVAFTFGSAMRHAAGLLATSALACQVLGRRGLLLTRHAEQVPTHLPEGVMHVDYAPFSQLLPRAAALVHHGGIGTESQAFAAGVPQLVVPFAHDQQDNADRVRRLGTGAYLPPRRYTPKRAAGALRSILNDTSVRARCRQIAERFAGTDPLACACEHIEQLAGATTHRPPPMPMLI